MGTTLHPLHYFAVARYILQRFLDNPTLAFKGKGRAAAESSRSRLLPCAATLAARTGLVRATVSTDDSTPSSSSSSSALHSHPSSSPSAASSDVTSPPPDLPPKPDKTPDPRYPPENTEIYRLMRDNRLFVPGAIKPPREIVVLCHGLYGFSTATPIPLFPSLKLHYWASVLEVLRDRMGVKVVVVGVKGTGSIKERAEQMHQFLRDYLPRGVGVNFVAHSMGGLDCRHLISTIRPTEYKPLSLTTIATPHRGSPFMDWCAANIGVGTPEAAALTAAAAAVDKAKGLPFTLQSPLLSRPQGAAKAASDTFSNLTSALSDYLLNIFDSPAYANLTTDYLGKHFNPATPNDPEVKYLSVAGRVSKMSVLHPLWFPKLVLDSAAEKGYPSTELSGAYEGNDGLVSVSSAKWGEFLGVVDGCHHWELRGEGGLWPNGATTSGKAEGKPDPSKTDGWDWQGGLGESLGLRLESLMGYGEQTGEKGDTKVVGLSGIDSQTDPEKRGRDLETARAMFAASQGSSSTSSSSPSSSSKSSSSSSSSSSSWDLAQVGQLIDWVADLFPGDKSSSRGTKQLADATREKERNDRAAGGMESSREREREREREKEREKSGKEKEKKKEKEKFDLARFYGGLMLRLREDGL